MTPKSLLLPPEIDPASHLWSDRLPGGAHWSYVVKRGTTIRFTDMEGAANLAVLMYNFDEKLERLNIPDTLKTQHTAHLAKGNALYSDMGRVLASICADTVGWHDPLCGVADAALIHAKFGQRRYQEHGNGMFRNGKDGLLIELGKWGLGLRDFVPTVNFFSKVVVSPGGELRFVPNHSRTGDFIELRFEMNTLLAVSSAPHPLDTALTYSAKNIAMTAWTSGAVAQDDATRLHCAENQRGFANTEQYYR